MKVDVLNQLGKKVNTAELPADIFEAPIKKDLIHLALVRQMANARLARRGARRRTKALEAEGHRTRTPGLPTRSAVGGRRQSAYSAAERF